MYGVIHIQPAKLRSGKTAERQDGLIVKPKITIVYCDLLLLHSEFRLNSQTTTAGDGNCEASMPRRP